MFIPSISAITPVIRKLESVFTLADDERAALMRLPIQTVDLRTDQDVIREGDRPSRCFAVLEGFACSFKITGVGKRQILGFHIPGDMPDLQSPTWKSSTAASARSRRASSALFSTVHTRATVSHDRYLRLAPSL